MPQNWIDFYMEEVFEESDDCAGFIYFILAEKSRLVKIGFARKPEDRVKDLQVSSFENLRLIATIPGAMRDEHELHYKFKYLRVRGEWFRMNNELIELIRSQRKTMGIFRVHDTNGKEKPKVTPK